jgi:hypothetical protein
MKMFILHHPFGQCAINKERKPTDVVDLEKINKAMALPNISIP